MGYGTVICCFRATAWTQLIAWLHIIFAVTGLAYGGILAALRLYDADARKAKEPHRDGTLEAAMIFLLAVMSTVCLTLGGLLLAASLQRNPKLMKVWLVGEAFFVLSMMTIAAIQDLWYFQPCHAVIYGVVYVLMSLFECTVVAYRISDLESSRLTQSKIFHV